jgi:orotidine-5'-phosphate decarboxylase
MNIIEKFEKRAKKINSLLCVGLDADFAKIPQRFLDMEFPQFEFNKYIIEETHEFTSAYKPNSAFFEARGDQGIKELKMTIDYLNKFYPDIVSILDAKRGDIGNTNNGYVQFIFDWLNFDAVTVYPYLGQEAVQPFLDRNDKAIIFLCRTSNAGAKGFQDLEV